MLRSRLNEWWPYLVIILAVIWPWLAKPGYIFLMDLNWWPLLHLDPTDSWYFAKLILQTISRFLPATGTEKLLFAVVLSLPLIGGTFLLRSLGMENRWLRFTLSLFALFNPFVYDRLLFGQIGVVMAFGCLLLVCSYLLQYVKNKNGKEIVFAGWWSGLSVMFSPHFIFFLGLIYLMFIVWTIGQRTEFDLVKLFKLLTLSVVVVLAINANWIYPYAFSQSQLNQAIEKGISRQDYYAFQTSGKNGWDAYKNVVMMSGFWGKDQNRYQDLTRLKDNWGKSFLILLPVIIYGVYLGLKNKGTRSLSLGLILLYGLAVVLAVGIKAPATGGISWWLYDHLPLYKGLREPQKWVALVVLIYLIFLSIGADALFKTKWLAGKKMIAGLFLGGVIIMQAPLLLWGLGGQVKPGDYPADWYAADKLIMQKDARQKNILFLPWHMYMGFKWIGRNVAVPASAFFQCPVISGTNMEWGGIYDNNQDVRGQAIGEWVKQKGGKEKSILNQYGVGYIILAKEVDWENYSWLNDLPDWQIIKDSQTLRVYGRKSP